MRRSITGRLGVLERLELRQLLYGGDLVGGAELAEVAEGEPGQVPDFALVDVNPNSATYNQQVSPRDYLGQISAWYFGHAT
jgi:hypothetical protein